MDSVSRVCDHNSDRIWGFEIENQMGKIPERVTAIAPLGEVEGKAPGMGFDFIDCGAEFSLEAISHVRPGFVVLVIDDFVEILLDQRVEAQATH